MKIISACLCGMNCKYNGKNNFDPTFLELVKSGEIIPVCPEQLGGLPTPRLACEIAGGTGLDVLEGKARVLNKDGQDLTEHFMRGAEETLKFALACGATQAILQSRSPSCGCGQIYDGSFSNQLIDGDGITSALLKAHGIQVINEQDYIKTLLKK